MTYRLRNLALATALALLAVLLTTLYVTSYERRVDSRQERVEVFVAARDIEPGTPASDFASTLKKREVPRESVSPAAVADLDQLSGHTTTQWIYAGEQVTLRRFATQAESGIRSQLKGTQRAMELPGGPQQLLAGTLQEGDRVDVIVSLSGFGDGGGGGGENIGRVLLRDLLVLRAPAGGGSSVDQKLASGGQGGSSVTLRVTDAQAHKLFFVTAENADHAWWLLLRNPNNGTDGPESVTTVKSGARDGLRGSQLDRVGGAQ
jgi:Flp pilus assembly protein CpaB